MTPETNAQIGKCKNSWSIFPKNVSMHVTSVTAQMPLKRSPIRCLVHSPIEISLLTPSQGVQLVKSSALTLPGKCLQEMNLLQWFTVHTMYQENCFTEHCIVSTHNIARTESVSFEVITLRQ